MPTAIITGAGGLIGAETTRFFHAQGFTVVGIDNDMRKYFFGPEASTKWNVSGLKKNIPGYYLYFYYQSFVWAGYDYND